MEAVSHDYRFAAEPRALDLRASKYREFIEEIPPANIMFDRRIVRGNTYASMIIPASTQQEIERQQAQNRQKSKNFKQKSSDQPEETLDFKGEQSELPNIEEPRDPETLMEAKTDPIMGPTLTQVEFYIDKPPSPLFIPNEDGVTESTQIEDGDLFDYDSEVDPILEVIVGKSLEHARMEVLEEYEIELMKKHKRAFTQKRDAELIEVQRQQAEFNRRKHEDDRRKLQARTQRELKRIAHEKYVCRLTSKRLLSNIRFDASIKLSDLGVFKDPSDISVHDQYLPWLFDSIQLSLLKEKSVDDMIESIFKQTVRELSRQHNEAVTVEYARREQIRQEEIRKRKETESRKQKRNELRAKRQAERERIALRNKINDELLSHGVTAEGITRQFLSDSDGRHTEPVVCSPGGLIGEFVIFLSSVEEVMEVELSQEQVSNFLLNYLNHGLNSPAMVYSNLTSLALERLNELAAEGLPSEYEAAVRLLLDFLLNPENSVHRTSVSLLIGNPENFGIRYGLVENFLYAFFSVFMAKEDNHLVEVKEKIMVKACDWTDAREMAVVRIKVPGVKSEDNEDDENPAYLPLPDDQIHDRVLMVTPSNEKVSVLIVHCIAQKFFREEMMNWLKTSKIVESIDLGKVNQVFLAKASDFEEKIIRLKSDNLPEYEFYIN